ncbi:hypothetical protein MMC28_004235 [Mycoblastus sanguinarius]|nr:hypothetical protein [Mycoblastus sanguinarius]
MLTTNIPLFLIPFLATTQALEPMLRSLDAILVEPREPASSPSPTPFLKHLDLRQAAAQAAAPDPAAVAPAAAAPAAVAPAAAAPAAGVGGAGNAPAAAQPAAGVQANPETTLMVQTVVGGVTTTVPIVYTQTFGAAASTPPVSVGSIGMGTLTGKIGVVKTQDAKSDAVALGKRRAGQEMAVVLISGLAILVGGLVGVAIL